MSGWSAGEFARRYDRHMASGLMTEFYVDTAFFNTGYWASDTASVDAAGERLVEEVCRPLNGRVNTILDVGNGIGGTTASLQRRHPSARVIALNVSIEQLARCREAGRGERVCCMDAAQLGIASAVADAIVAVESPLHFVSRARFFADAARVLRPGGWLVLSDVLFRDPHALGSWLCPSDDAPASAGQYAALFDDGVWSDVAITDATGPCWMGFCDRWDAWTSDLHAAGSIGATERAQHAALVDRWRHAVGAQYLIVAARRAS